MSTCIHYLGLYTCQLNAMAAGLVAGGFNPYRICIHKYSASYYSACLHFNVLAKDRIKSIILLNRKFYFQRIIILLTVC